jgi:hypothetical protein
MSAVRVVVFARIVLYNTIHDHTCTYIVVERPGESSVHFPRIWNMQEMKDGQIVHSGFQKKPM